MGFELELESNVARVRRGRGWDRRAGSLVEQWQRACERFEIAHAALAALRGHVSIDDPRWIAAQLGVAEARQRRHEAAERMRSLDVEYGSDA